MFSLRLPGRPGPKLRRARWPLAVGVAALVPMLLLAAQGQGDKDSATVSREAAEKSAPVGEPVYLSFAGTPAQEPTQTAECMVGGIGQKSAWSSPTWKWHFTSKRIPATPTPAPGGTSTAPGGTAPAPGAPAAPAPDEGSVTNPAEDMKQTVSSGTTFTATQAGDYEVTASVVVAYSADCKTGAPTSGELKGQNTTIVHVGTGGTTGGDTTGTTAGNTTGSTTGTTTTGNTTGTTTSGNTGGQTTGGNTTPAPQQIPFTATALTWNPTDSNSIELKWTGAAGTLYGSTKETFPLDETTHIPRGAAENDGSKTSYLHTGLKPETQYYYVLVPNGNSNLTQAPATAKTTGAPKVVIDQNNINPEIATVGEAVEAKLHAEIKLPSGVTTEGETTWEWGLADVVKFSATEPTSESDWKTGGASYIVGISYDGTATANQFWIFNTVGYYRVKVKAVAHTTINGKPVPLEAIETVGN